MAEIVGCADTDKLADHPVAAGLEAMATGYSLRFPDDAEDKPIFEERISYLGRGNIKFIYSLYDI